MLINKFSGLIVPLLTPLNEDLSVDFFGLKTLTAKLQNKGVKNFFVLNTYSEYEFISIENKKKIIKQIINDIGLKGNVLVGCFGASSEQIIEQVKLVEKYSQYCVVNVPFNALTDEVSFIDFFDKLFTKTKAQIILLNDPLKFKRNIPIIGIDRIAGWEKLIGIIDYSKNTTYFNALSDYHQSLKIFQGQEQLAIESFNHKCAGLVLTVANIIPELFINLKNNFELFGYNQMIRQELSILHLMDSFPKGKEIQAYKHILSTLGIIQPYYFDSLEKLDSKEMEELNQLIKKSFA